MKLGRKFITIFKDKWQLVVLVVLALTPAVWYIGRGTAIINGIDTNFPLDPLIWIERRFYVWNPVVNMGSDFSSSLAGTFFHSIQTVPFLLGMNLQLIQLLSFVFWFGAIVLSSYYAAFAVGIKDKMARIVFVILYSYNIYLFNTWENVKVSNLSLVVGLPLFLGTFALAKRREISSRAAVLIWAISTFIISGAGINPAYFLVLLIGVGVYAALDSLKSVKLFFVFALITLTISSFWLFPTLKYLLFSSKPIANLGDIGFTNWLDSLSVNTSLTNLLRLQGAWDWYEYDAVFGAPLYLPYVVNYANRLPFVLFSFLSPVLVFLSLLFVNKKFKTEYLYFGVLFVVGIFFGAGSHSPTGQIYIFLTKVVPFFSFFRSPWYIFTPLTTMGAAGLVALFVDRVVSGRFRWLALSITAVLLFGHFLYSYPLVTGKIFRPSRSDGFYVNFPGYVWETKDWLASQPCFPRVITYPDDDLENFDWGYRGVESILSLFSCKEFVSPGFNQNNEEFSVLQKEFYKRMKRGEYSSAIGIMRMFGADTIFYKRDQKTLAPEVSQDLLKIANRKTIGDWDFYSQKDTDTSKFYVPRNYYVYHGKADVLAGSVAFLGELPAAIKSGDTAFDKSSQLSKLSASDIYELEKENEKYSLESPEDGEYFLYLESYGLDNPVLNFEDKEYTPLEKVSGFYKYGPFSLDKSLNNVEVQFPEPENIFRLKSYENLFELSGIRQEALPEDMSKTMVVYGRSTNEYRISVPVEGFDPYAQYELRLDYKYFYGELPYIEVIQSTSSSPVRTFRISLSSAYDWESRSLAIDLVPTPSFIDVFVVLSGNDRDNLSKSFIENLSLKKIYDNKIFAVKDVEKTIQSAKISVDRKSPVEYEIQISNTSQGTYLIFQESYTPEWKIDVENSSVSPIHFKANGVSNGWYIPLEGTEGRIRVYYEPNKYYKYGLVVTLLSLIGVFAYYVKEKN